MPVTNQKILKTVERLGTTVGNLGVTVEKLAVTVEDLAVTMKEGFKKIDEKLDIIEMYVANHDNALKALPTREEFEKHKEENLNFQYAVATKLELKEFAKA